MGIGEVLDGGVEQVRARLVVRLRGALYMGDSLPSLGQPRLSISHMIEGKLVPASFVRGATEVVGSGGSLTPPEWGHYVRGSAISKKYERRLAARGSSDSATPRSKKKRGPASENGQGNAGIARPNRLRACSATVTNCGFSLRSMDF